MNATPKPLQPQITQLIDAVDQSTHEWHKLHILINPPGYAPATLLLLAEIHGRIGHFPSLIRLRPRLGPMTSYEVAELLNLQTIRDATRKSSDASIMPGKRAMKSLL